MKISIVLTEGQKQVMMTPETQHERDAISMISPTDTLQVISKVGSFDSSPSHVSENVSLCQGGYLRRFPEADTVMFLISDSKSSDKK